MSALLNEFSLLPPHIPPLPDWPALPRSLDRQARLLGLRTSAATQPIPDNAAFMLQHPELQAITAEYVLPKGWTPAQRLSENLLQAACGLMSVHGRASGQAQALGVNYLSTLTAAMALQGTLAAALGQIRGGEFRKIRVAPLRCGLLSIGQYLAGATAQEEHEHYLPGTSDMALRPPFRSSDGIVFELETLDSAPWRAFWSATGIPSEIAGAAWRSFLLRYARAISPLPNICLETLARMPYADIQRLAADTGIALVPLRTAMQRREDTDYQSSLGSPWQVETIGNTGHGTTRPFGSGTLPLHGLRVIESCRRIQGPLAGHILALLGAEVVRLEPPGGDPLRAMPPCADGCSVRFDALNHLKTIIEVDIKTLAGQHLIHELVRESDVFLHNWAPGKARELNLDASDLIATQPALVYAYAGGWGNAPVTAPGTDFTVQAWSGVAHAIATASGTRGGSLFTVLDVLGGTIAALGVTAALLKRTTTGGSIKIASSLLGSADLLMQDSLPQFPITSDRLSGVYPTAAGRIAIDSRQPVQQTALAKLLRLDATDDRQALEAELLTRTALDWEQILNKNGIGACQVIEDLTQLTAVSPSTDCLDLQSYASVNSPWSFL